jgi:hypothetical protein
VLTVLFAVTGWARDFLQEIMKQNFVVSLAVTRSFIASDIFKIVTLCVMLCL